MSSYANIFITGASRGIGLELVKQFATKETTKQIFATCRDMSRATELKQVAADNEDKVKIIELDMRGYDKYERVVDQVTEEVGDKGLNLLINNAGIHMKANCSDLNLHDIFAIHIEAYEVNVVASLLLTRALTPLLLTSAKAGHKTLVANMSTKPGSISDTATGKMYARDTTKSTFNQVPKCLAIQFEDDGIVKASVQPGWFSQDTTASDTNSIGVKHLIEALEDITPAINLPLEELDLPDPSQISLTPAKKMPRESIAQWSVQRRQKKMTVKNLANLLEGAAQGSEKSCTRK